MADEDSDSASFSSTERLLPSEWSTPVIDQEKDRYLDDARDQTRSSLRRFIPSITVILKWIAVLLVCITVSASAFAWGYQRGERNYQPTVLAPSQNATCAPEWSHQGSLNQHALALPQSTNEPADETAITFTNGTVFDQHAEMKMVGVVFFGRRKFVDVLDCYLRKNLVINGGVLDEIRFIVHTREEEDRQWLEDLVQRDNLQDHYTLQYEDTARGDWNLWGSGFKNIWSNMTDPDTIYVKIDDDIVFMEEKAIPELVRTVLEHPEAHSVMANTINNRWTHWYHYRAGAIYPYLPDTNASQKAPTSWLPSSLPRFSSQLPDRDFDFNDDKYKPPFEHHRWLPLVTQNLAVAIAYTPYGCALPKPNGQGGDDVHWAVVAQSHYSLFENLERGTLAKYYFGNGWDGSHNLDYVHYSINTMAVRGSHVAMMPFWDDDAATDEMKHEGDETILTEIIPKMFDMPVLLASRSIVSHFAYGFDREEVLKTDILDRYRLYANERVCSATNQKTAFPEG